MFTKLGNYTFGSAEAMDGLMDRLDKLPGDMFGGNLQELITNKVDASTRKFKERMLIFRRNKNRVLFTREKGAECML